MLEPMPRFILSLAFCAMFPLSAGAQAPTQAAEPDNWDARLSDSKGDVKVYSPTEGAEALPVEKDMPLQEGDRIVTGTDASADLSLDGVCVCGAGSGVLPAK